MSEIGRKLNPSKPLFWACIGALVGFLAALGGEDNRLMDGIFGAFVQFLLWFGVSSLILKNKGKRKAVSELKTQLTENSISENVVGSDRKIALWIWFLISYAAPVVGGISGRFRQAQSWSQISGESQVSIVLKEVTTLAGLIDTFIFPSLASAITITASIYFYRRVVVKLKRRELKPLMVGLFVISTVVVWVLLSFALAMAVSTSQIY
jgi:hypothetical protein